MPQYLVLLLVIASSVLLIVTDQRFNFEKRLRRQYGIDRDWWIPPIILVLGILLSFVGWPSIKTAFREKFEIIVLILSFGIIAEGLGASGFFKFIAYRVVNRCEGDSTKLILALFAITSLITFFTSNDIVVLVMTPIIVAICFQAKFLNTKLILLSQFIAANTLSMGMLIGSPTNLIMADEMKIDFFSYFFLMVLPALVAFSSSLLLIYWTTKVLKKDWKLIPGFLDFQSTYSVPDDNPEPLFTKMMRDWLIIFLVFVILVALVTYWHWSLLWCAIPGLVIAFLYWRFSEHHEAPITKPTKNLPYGIFFFGMTFFVLAEEFSKTGFVNHSLVPFLETYFRSNPTLTPFAGLFGAGLSVNLFNDLPAAAIVAKVVSKLSLKTALTEDILIQATLVGLNIGCYVTKIGALAGLIWFNQLRVERSKQEQTSPELASKMIFPTRMDLVRYGSLHFLFAGTMVGIFLTIEWLILSL